MPEHASPACTLADAAATLIEALPRAALGDTKVRAALLALASITEMLAASEATAAAPDHRARRQSASARDRAA